MRSFLTLPLAIAATLIAPIAAMANTVVTQTGPGAVRADYVLDTPDGRVLRGSFFLAFDDSVGLTPAALNIRARIVDPTDPTLLARLPVGLPLTVPTAFPVMVSVNPIANSGFQFVNAAQVEMYTKALPYSVDSAYRLYKAPSGGVFADLTEGLQPGSVRMRVRTGGFSDFLVVEDLRTPSAVATELYTRLSTAVADDDVPVATRALLDVDLAKSAQEFQEGDYRDARKELASLALVVDTEAGISLPNVWRAQRDLDNRAGELAALIGALDFHLARLAKLAGPDSGEDDGGDACDDD